MTTKSGFYKNGKSHEDGGIPVLVDGSKEIEVELHEYKLCNNAIESTKIFEFKDKTNKEILDEIFQYSDCEFKQNEASSGDFIICKLAVLDNKKRNITGTTKEIINVMQSEKSCNVTNDSKEFKDGGEINNEYIIFFKSKLNNDIIYSNVKAESLQSAIDRTKSLYNWTEILWIKGFELKESNEGVQFFYEAIKNYWSSNKFINIDLVDGQIIFTGYGNSVAFDFIAKFLKKENDVKVFDGGYLFNDDLDIEINPDFTFDDSKIIEYLSKYKNDGYDIRYADGGSIPEQGTLYTRDKKTKLEYIKNGSDYEFIVYEAEENPVSENKGDGKSMNYNQFVNYLYSETYIDDKETFVRGGEIENKDETYTKWKKLVNMSKSELEKFYNSEDGKKAGLSASEAKSQGIDSGRESARWIMKMKDTPKSEWTPNMWRWAKKQISFISRMSGMKGDLYDDKGNKTRKHTSLLIWGHNPEKYNDGGSINKNDKIMNDIKLSSRAIIDVNGEKLVKEIYGNKDHLIELLYSLDSKNLFQIYYIFVSKDIRRLGIGSKLMDLAKNKAIELGFDNILCLVADYKGEDYDNLVSFYKKNGFEFVENSDKKMTLKLDTEFNNGSLKLMKWYIDWYKGISDKMNITLSLPNLLSPFKENNVVIMDLFEKIDQTIDAKKYLQEIINKADEYKVTLYLEPIPRYKYFLDDAEKIRRISKEYLISYYEKFGFELTPNRQFMKRNFKEQLKNGGELTTNEVCEKFIKEHKNILKNGYYSFINNIGIFADSYGGKMPKINSLIIISYNSGGQNNLKVTDTINPVVLQKQIGELIEEESGIPKIIISKHLTSSKRVSENIYDIIKNNNVVIIDRDEVVCSNLKNKLKNGGELKTNEMENKIEIIATKDKLNISVQGGKYGDGKFGITSYPKAFEQLKESKNIIDKQHKIKVVLNPLVMPYGDAITIIKKLENYADDYGFYVESKIVDNGKDEVEDIEFGGKTSIYLVNRNYEYKLPDWIKVGNKYKIQASTGIYIDMILEKINVGVIGTKYNGKGLKFSSEHTIITVPYDELDEWIKDKKILPIESDLQKGIKVESEHKETAEKLYNQEITPDQAAESIAKEHLAESPKYYDELEKMENKLKTESTINSTNVTNWNEVPKVWKNTEKVKKVNFINSPYNKDLIKLMTPFTGDDNLRPIMSGIHFDENGITATDAHKLISLPYPNKDFNGTYATVPKKFLKDDTSIKNDLFADKYPNYIAITPTSNKAERVQEISVYKLLQYTEVALHYAINANKQVVYSLGDIRYGLNGEFLIEILKTALKLGHEKLYAFTTLANRAIVFSDNKNYELGKDLIFLLMPIMLLNDYEHKGEKYNSPLGAEDLDFDRSITVYYDFSKDEIINADGSVAEFKMNYGEYDVLNSNEIKILKNFAKNNTIPILDYFRVKDNKISASDLETYFTIKNTDLKDGLYHIIDNAVEYDPKMTLSDFEQFPNSKWEDFENKIKFSIDSETLAHYVKLAIDFTSNDDLRPVFTGILLDYRDSQMFIVSTDANKLFKVNITQYIDIDKDQKDFQFILSKNNLLKFIENIDDSKLTISATKEYAKFENDEFIFESRLIDGKYPNYNAVISSFKNKKLTINIKDLFNCIKSKEAETFIKSNKGEDILIYDSNDSDKLKISLGFKETGYGSQFKMEKSVEICKVNYTLENGDYQTKDNLILLMPILGYSGTNNFIFNVKFFKTALETLNCEDIELFYDETNRAYILGGDCFSYKHTIKAKKEPKVVTAKEEPKKEISSEQKEWKDAISTFNELISIGGSESELKEWNEAIDTFKILLGDDAEKFAKGGDIITHVQYKSVILETIGKNNYLRVNEESWKLTDDELKKINKELEEYNNPLSAANYLSNISKNEYEKVTMNKMAKGGDIENNLVYKPIKTPLN